MVAAAYAIQVAPRDQREVEQVSKLYRSLLHEGTAALIGPDGTRIDLPMSVHEILVRVVEKMQEGKAIAVLPLMEELSTLAAADLLGVSQPFFARECEAHKLAFSLHWNASACAAERPARLQERARPGAS